VSKFYSYITTASGIINQYKGDMPLSVFLKSFFGANKKYGSKDRKQIAHICYCYYRLGKIVNTSALQGNDELLKQYMLLGLFVCSIEPNPILETLMPDWNNKVYLPIEEKFFLLKKSGMDIEMNSVFPWPQMLSSDIDYHQFCKSFFIQPNLFLRIRPEHKSTVIKKLTDAQIGFTLKNDNTVALPNLTKIDEIVLLDKEVVVQDYSSQKISNFFKPVKADYTHHTIKLWDCCAASGGKSILAKDYFGDIDLTVCDIRASILINLQSRFKRAGINRYTAFVANLAQRNTIANTLSYNLIICDVPCSGSGTWSRTPEQLFFWQKDNIAHYVDLQKKIIDTIIPFIKPNGYLLYITCSVFKKENEEMAEMITQKYNLTLIDMQVIKGYNEKADTMFAALMKKPV
jgi:16S rRNA (cytosine967-C5)-methyltransferase